MCGAITFDLTGAAAESGACHCGMCRHWTGGVYIAVQVPAEGMRLEGQDHLKVFKSSDWAERAFCGTCGSSLWYRITAPGPMEGVYHLGIGTLDDPSGLPLKEELFIDLKPDGYSFAQETHQMTTEEVIAMFAQS